MTLTVICFPTVPLPAPTILQTDSSLRAVIPTYIMLTVFVRQKQSTKTKKLSKILRTSKLENRKILIEQNFYALGVGITFSFNISNKIINTIANIFVS